MQVTLANWRTAPFNRWAFHHVRELIPSADIAHGSSIRPLAEESIGLGLEAFLRETDTDGFAVVHRGRLVLEYYANGMTQETPHILMSVSKSMLGLLIHELGMDADAEVTAILPELRATAYRGATIRHLLDMRAGIVWDENYLAASGPIIEYRKASGWNPSDGSSDLHSFYAMLKEATPHGGVFHYTSPNSDLLGWVVERASGRRYAELMSERVWKPMGAERSAYITVDRLGAPRCAGGMCVTLRDLARVGQWLIESRPGFLESLQRGDAAAWAAGDLRQYFPGLPMRYRDQWYVWGDLYFGLGIHGQNLFVDPAREIVVAKLSSQAQPLDAARIALTMRTVAELRQRLG
jgi:CubicO group peptidase (beta-lactamase class C family)